MKIKKMIHRLFKKIRLLCLFVLLLLSANKVDANADSLRQIWTNIAQPDTVRFNAIHEYYNLKLFGQPDSVILLTTYHIELAEQKKSEREKAKALNKKAIAYYVKDDSEKALKEMNKVVDIYASLNDSLNLMKTYNNLALIYAKRIEYQKAIEFYSKSLDFYEKNKIEGGDQSATLINVGLIHVDLKNYELGLDYFNKSLHLYEKAKIENTIHVGNLWLNIGRVNFERKHYQQAIENCQKALKIYKSLQKQYYIAYCYTLNAKVYQGLNQPDSSFFYIRKSLKLHREIGTNLLILKDQIILANLIFPTDVNKATKIGEEVLKTAGNYDDHSLKIELYDLLYKCYKKKGNHPLTLFMLEKYNVYSDSLRMEQDKLSFTKNAIQTEYEREISKEQIENKKNQAKLKLNQTKITYTILFIGTLIFLCVVFYARSKRKILDKEKEVLVDKIEHLEELENTRDQLIESDKMASLGQLTAGVAHEINNPVNFISSGIIGLKKTLKAYIEAPKDEESGEMVEDMNDMISAIEEGARRTSNIVQSLQLFSREDTENYIESDLIIGLESTITLLSNKLKENILLERDFEKEAILVHCFPGQLNQVFMNVLLNAIQAVEGGGTIKIGVKEQAENIIITIADNGPGIPDDKKQKIFEAFYTTKGIQEGTGLGLSISSGIIKKHKGSIEVKDHDPKGTKFIIKLPNKEKE